jgi:hypothetical protein
MSMPDVPEADERLSDYRSALIPDWPLDSSSRATCRRGNDWWGTQVKTSTTTLKVNGTDLPIAPVVPAV